MKTHRIAAAIAAIVLPLLAADAQAAELKAPCAATSPCGTIPTSGLPVPLD
jgi:hypothetical protein